LNGEFPVEADDAVSQPTSQDVSGSDTDSGRPEGSGSKTFNDEKGHSRSNSVKKPVSFKKASFAKTVLAKAVGGTVPGSKLSGETTSAATSTLGASAMRPRLVAKQGGVLKDAVPRGNTGAGANGRGTGADGKEVWNKNKRETLVSHCVYFGRS
jgi:hypothetical protein